jgi:hypothetical protein
MIKVDAPGQVPRVIETTIFTCQKELYVTHTNTHTPTDISAHEEDNISNGLRLHRHKTLTFEKLTYL